MHLLLAEIAHQLGKALGGATPVHAACYAGEGGHQPAQQLLEAALGHALGEALDGQSVGGDHARHGEGVPTQHLGQVLKQVGGGKVAVLAKVEFSDKAGHLVLELLVVFLPGHRHGVDLGGDVRPPGLDRNWLEAWLEAGVRWRTSCEATLAAS